MQKIRKKYQTVKAVGPELTYIRTHESEFIGSFRSLKTSGEPIIRDFKALLTMEVTLHGSLLAVKPDKLRRVTPQI